VFVYDNERLKEELLRAVDEYHQSAAKLQKLAIQALFTLGGEQQRPTRSAQPAVATSSEENASGRVLLDQ